MGVDAIAVAIRRLRARQRRFPLFSPDWRKLYLDILHLEAQLERQRLGLELCHCALCRSIPKQLSLDLRG